MEPGDVVYSLDEYWVILQVCFTNDDGTYALAVQQDFTPYDVPRVILIPG